MRLSAIGVWATTAVLLSACGSSVTSNPYLGSGASGSSGHDAARDTLLDAPHDGAATADAHDGGGGAGDAGADASTDGPVDAPGEHPASQDAATDAIADAPADTPVTPGDAMDAPSDVPADVPTSDSAATEAGADDAVDATAGADAGTDAGPRLVTLQFTGTVQTVAGTPLGLDASVRLAPITGELAYDLNVLDANPTDPQRGRYLHDGTSQFTFAVSGHTVMGSGLAIVEVEDLNPDTFRFRDGPQNDTVTRLMTLDGTGDPSLVLLIAITDDSGAALTSDAEPDPFPFTNITAYPHTFSLEDDGGTLLMQLDSITMQ